MQTVLEHITELRKRIIIILCFVPLFLLIGILLSGYVIEHIITDIPPQIIIITIAPLAYLMTQLKVSIVIAFLFLSPVILYQGIIFIKPAMTRSEKQALLYILPAAICLFMAGVIFGYVVFLKIALFFLSQMATVPNLWNIQNFISFVMTVCVSMGIIFEIPLVIVILKKIRVVDARILATYRPLIYTGLLVFAGIVTPPDIVTLIIMVIPLILLYEISVLLIR